MALWLPGDAGTRVQTATVPASTTYSVTVTGSGTANTKGSWTQLVSTTSFDVDEIVLTLAADVSSSATDTCTLLDIGIGGSGSEAALIPNINIGATLINRQIRFPIRVPTGTRVSARLQSAQTSKSITAMFVMLGYGGWDRPISGRRATNYGANTADSSGVLIDNSGASNVDGLWTEITSATTVPMRWMIPMLSGAQGNTNWTPTNKLIDIGTGASGSEVELIADIPLGMSSAEWLTYPSVTYPVDIPTGTRLAARLRQSGSGTSVEATIIGID